MGTFTPIKNASQVERFTPASQAVGTDNQSLPLDYGKVLENAPGSSIGLLEIIPTPIYRPIKKRKGLQKERIKVSNSWSKRWTTVVR